MEKASPKTDVRGKKSLEVTPATAKKGSIVTLPPNSDNSTRGGGLIFATLKQAVTSARSITGAHLKVFEVFRDAKSFSNQPVKKVSKYTSVIKYYAVSAPEGTTSGGGLIFATLKQAVTSAKSITGARFKVFKKFRDAQNFSNQPVKIFSK